jgi:hypothetical protein
VFFQRVRSTGRRSNAQLCCNIFPGFLVGALKNKFTIMLLYK